jgi:hypothetical protein
LLNKLHPAPSFAILPFADTIKAIPERIGALERICELGAARCLAAAGRQRSSDKTADCLREGSRLIVALTRSNDETSEQKHTGERGEDGPGYPASRTSASFGGREDPHCAGGAFAVKSHCRALPQGGYQPEPRLSLVEGVSGAGKKRLAGDTAREATSDEVKELKAEARQLKETLAEVPIEIACSKKAVSGMGRTHHEVFRARKVRGQSGTVVALDPSDIGADRDPEIDVL